MRKLIESTFVTLGGDIGAPQDWALPYLAGDEHDVYARDLVFGADALLLGRRTYEGLSAAYSTMASPGSGPVAEFIDRMNAMPKYVASTTLSSVGWNSTLLAGDVAEQVADLKRQPGNYLLKYGTGPLDRTLVANGLVDEFRIWIVPVTNPPGQRLFEDLPDTKMTLIDSRTFGSGVVLLTYAPDTPYTGAAEGTAAAGRRTPDPPGASSARIRYSLVRGRRDSGTLPGTRSGVLASNPPDLPDPRGQLNPQLTTVQSRAATLATTGSIGPPQTVTGIKGSITVPAASTSASWKTCVAGARQRGAGAEPLGAADG